MKLSMLFEEEFDSPKALNVLSCIPAGLKVIPAIPVSMAAIDASPHPMSVLQLLSRNLQISKRMLYLFFMPSHIESIEFHHHSFDPNIDSNQE